MMNVRFAAEATTATAALSLSKTGKMTAKQNSWQNKPDTIKTIIFVVVEKKNVKIATNQKRNHKFLEKINTDKKYQTRNKKQRKENKVNKTNTHKH